jgi:soluble lytic murein transglycosylase-like protein
MQLRMPMRGPQFVLAAGILAASCMPAHAAEQITLTNGFEISCHHHASVHRRVRLYMGTGSDSYIEVAPNEIASVEKVPDPPAPPAETVALAPAAQSPRDADPGNVDLTPGDLHEMLAKASHEHNVDVDLLASVVKAESGGNARAVSRAGAQGLMQLMPETAADLGVTNTFHPEQNVRGGSTYLDELLTRYHDNLSLALAAYNAGPAAVDKYHGIPPYRETRLYVARVIHEFNRRVRARQAQEKRAVASASAHGN